MIFFNLFYRFHIASNKDFKVRSYRNSSIFLLKITLNFKKDRSKYLFLSRKCMTDEICYYNFYPEIS